MSKLITALVLTAGTIGLSAGSALAADYDGHYPRAARQAYNGGYNARSQHIYNDQRELARDAAKVREEQAELAAAQRKARWAWMHGDYWTAKKAQHEIREEREELAEARQKYHAQRQDIIADIGERPHHHYHHHRHWWYYR